MKKASVLVMAGGTGGHVIPAISVAREMMQKGYDVHWLGSVKGIENDLVPDAGYPLHKISVTGLRGNGALKLVFAPFQLLKALWQTWKVFRLVKPAMCLGMGGFASGPGGIMSVLTRTPLVIHEQNAYPGMTNKSLSRFAKFLLQAFDGTFTERSQLYAVGNPVRSSIVNIEAPEQRLKNRSDELNVLVVGGSLGAVAINETIIDLAKDAHSNHISIWHQVGKRNFEAVKASYKDAGVDSVKVSAFISDMAEAYSWADVIVCRSGALTVSEIMAAGIASILVPYPHAVDDHQTANGQFLVNAGAALMMPQDALSKGELLTKLIELKNNRNKLLDMSKAARTLAKPDAAKVVANYCIEAIHG